MDGLGRTATTRNGVPVNIWKIFGYLRLGLATVPLCRGTGAPFDEHRRPLAPSKFFDVCVTEKKYGYVIL